MATGRIQNRALIQQAANVLDVEGVKRFPSVLNLDDVKAVYILGGLQAPPLFSLGKSYPEAYAMGGFSGWSQDIAGALSSGILGSMYVNDNFSLDLVGLEVELEYDAAGALADNGVVLNLYLFRYENYGSGNQNIVLNLARWQVVATGTTSYRFNLASFYQGTTLVTPSLNIPNYLHIPKGDRFGLSIGRVAGGVFPANTSMFIQAHALTQEEQPQTAFAGVS